MASSTGPWDETDDSAHSASYDQPTSKPPTRSTLRASHLRETYPHPASSSQRVKQSTSSRSRMGGVVAEKVEDLAASLQATTEVLSTADRMLEHYRDINVEQDEEIAKLRAELERSANMLRRERISRRRRLPATPSSSQSEDEHGRPSKRGTVRFHHNVQSDVDDLRHAVRNLKSEQSHLSGELERERGSRFEGDPWGIRQDARIPMDGTEVTLRGDPGERQRLLRELRETEEASRRQAEILVKGLDAERDVLRESQRLASERDRELESLRYQLQANQKSQQDEIESRLKQIQEEMRTERESWEKKQQEVGQLASELRNVRSLLDEANDKKVRDEIRSVASELENERRALEKSEYEKQVLSSRVDDLSGRLDLAERGRREVMAQLEATLKRLDQTEGGRNALADQAEQLRQQFAHAETEKTQLSKKLEEAHGKLEENESSRKTLQRRLDGLNRQLEEGLGDRDRLVEKLETLRGQAAKAEREKGDVMQQVARFTQGVGHRRVSVDPHVRRSVGRTEGLGSNHVSELRRNLDRSEIERGLDRRNHGRMDVEDLYYDGLSGRNHQREDLDRLDLVNNLELLHHDIDRKDEQQERLLSQMRDLLSKYEESEEQKKRFMNELETVTKKLKEATKEVEEVGDQLEERENQLKESEKKRTELKNKALKSIKEYRAKCKRLEREAEQGHEAMLRSEKLERELRELRSIANSGGVTAGSFIGTSKREIDGLMDQRQRLNDELASKNAEIRELQAVRYNAERDLVETKKSTEKLEADLREQQAQLSAVNLEKMKLEEALQTARMNKKQDEEKLEVYQKKQEEDRAELELTVAEYKREIKDLRTKVAKLLSKLQEEAAQRQDYEERIIEAREHERSSKDEAGSLYSQLQQERDAHTNALRELEEQIQSLMASHEQALQEATKKSSKLKSELEGQIADMKIQLADEKSTIKALRKRQEKDREEIEKLNTEVNVTTEESNKLKTLHEQLKEENDVLKEKVEVNQTRIAQLEDSLRRSQYALEKAAEDQQSGLQKVDDQLDRVVEQVCRDSETPLPSLLASGSIRNNSQHWIADMIGKFRWLSEELKALLSTERRLKEQADWSQKRIREVVQKADEDKEYFISELDKQSMLLDELAAQKKGLESKNKQNTDNIKALQDRISQLTSHLETSTRALHATAEALDDRQKVLEEFEGLRGEQKERDKIHDKYVRYKERVGSIRRELQGAKSIAEDYRQETLDARNLSATLLESLDRISSPKAKQRRLHQFPDTPPTNMRPSTSKTNPTTEWSPSSESTISTASENPTPLSSPVKDRKRSHRIQDHRMKGPMAVTDLDNKER